MSTYDQELEAAFDVIRNNSSVSNRIKDAVRRKDFENVARIVGEVLSWISSALISVGQLVDEVIEWFSKL